MTLRKHVPRYAGLALAALCLPGCISFIIPARMYNLSTGQVITAELDQTDAGHGEIRASMFGGEMFFGEYVLASRRAHPQAVRRVPTYFGIQPDDTTPPDELEADRQREWAERYGFGANSNAQPVGTGTVVGNRGTVIELVLYSYRDQPEVHADGIGRDNRGNWYRVHVGEVTFSY